MRKFEAILLLFTIANVLFYNVSSLRKKKWVSYAAEANMAVLVLHSLFEGVRWQIYPIYILTFIYFIVSSYEIISKKNICCTRGRKVLRMLSIVISMFFIILSSSALYILPVKNIDRPAGNYSVGTVSYEVVDEDRIEFYGSDAGSKRRIMVQAWYPAKSISGLKRTPWIEHGSLVAPGIAEAMRLPKFLLNHTAYVMSNSYDGADLAEEITHYPVIVISHGWRGFRNLHTDYAEELASHGYIVLSVDHTYGSNAVVFPNGTVAYLDKDALPDRANNPVFLDYAYKLVSTYSSDIQLALNEVEKWNSGEKETIFKARIDLDKIGVVGHSTGGGGAVKASIEDYRIKALIGLDAWVESLKEEELQAGLGIPTLFFRSEQWQQGLNNKNLTRLVANTRNNTYFYQIQGTSHFDFSMVYMYSPLIKRLGFSGSLDSKIGSKLQKEYIITFFNEYLFRDREGDTEKLQDKYDMVKLLQRAKKVGE
jgi:dienelactone hydrolase